MKTIIHIATTEDGTELNIGEHEGMIGILVCIEVDAKPFMTLDDPDCLEKKFGKEAVEKAQKALEYLHFKTVQNDPRELFEGLVPDIMNVINEMKEEKK